ncbi:Endoglucanase [Heracleum sosnowskyi]|uniref:Endoglucanase n=1 Tax=Heracleum sosnowskyi TaxID=360622 RepID=A0AAD8JBT4_9APIA|nr:Endoglucanase [Heracleum sosnowskyi]
MHSANHWGGALEIVGESQVDSTDDHRSQNADWDKASRKSYTLDETQRSWLLDPETRLSNKKNKYVDLGCIVCSRKALKWSLGMVALAFLVIGMPIIISKYLPENHHRPLPPDDFTLALHKALLFFDAQKSGRLPKNNYSINWRGDSGLQDGNTTERGLVGGYYDAGDNIKFHFPMSFALTMLSWSLIEYEGKYKAIDEYEHVRDLIKWGTDYLLLTFNSSASSVPYIYSQVGGSMNGSTVPDDHTCWTRPEDMDYPRPVQTSYAGPELAGEMAAALAAASIVFRDNNVYSEKLAKGAATVFEFGRDQSKRRTYSSQNPYIEHYYNSSGYYDEYMWGAAWLYYATGNRSYVSLATNQGLPSDAHAFSMNRDLNVLSWDNKLPAAMMLLTRLRIFLNPGYPYEAMLSSYHNKTGLTMCSYLQRYNVYNWTQGGLIQLNHGRGQPLQYVANAAFLASLFADYLNATGVPGWNCGPDFILTEDLRSFASSQINYILGANPMNMSYVVGYGNNYPKRVHHRGASIPNDNKKYSCRGGWKWYQSRNSNPNTIIGAMVGGPNKFDEYEDIRSDYSHGEPTVAGNAGLVAALVSLTTSGGQVIEKNIIFSAVPPLYPPSPPPPSPWKP